MNENQSAKQNRVYEIDLINILKIFWRRKFLLILAGILGGAIAFAYTYFLVTPQYTATIYLYANNAASHQTSDSTYQKVTTSDLSASARIVDTYAAMICREVVLDQVIQETGINISVEVLAKSVAVAAENETEVFKVSVTNPSPQNAMVLANAIAEVAPERIAEIAEGTSVKVVDYAKLPDKMSSPNIKKNILIGILIGIVICALIIILMEIFDTRLKTEEDFEVWGLPVLGSIPDFSNPKNAKKYGYNYDSYAYGYDTASKQQKGRQ